MRQWQLLASAFSWRPKIISCMVRRQQAKSNDRKPVKRRNIFILRLESQGMKVDINGPRRAEDYSVGIARSKSIKGCLLLC